MLSYSKLRGVIENPPRGCLMDCPFHKQTHKGVWTSRSRCNLLNRELTNHDFQDNKPQDCPFVVALYKML